VSAPTTPTRLSGVPTVRPRFDPRRSRGATRASPKPTEMAVSPCFGIRRGCVCAPPAAREPRERPRGGAGSHRHGPRSEAVPRWAGRSASPPPPRARCPFGSRPPPRGCECGRPPPRGSASGRRAGTAKSQIEPWLSSCRAVEAQSSCCRGLACRACRGLSRLTPCACASRSVELSRSCRALSSFCRVILCRGCRVISVECAVKLEPGMYKLCYFA